ncbi:hypothetical protein Dpoa2040_000614 [Dickeya sp. CFBP 2040]|nr:hypothetical protein [Dickeya sp. CFBP 2040]
MANMWGGSSWNQKDGHATSSTASPAAGEKRVSRATARLKIATPMKMTERNQTMFASISPSIASRMAFLYRPLSRSQISLFYVIAALIFILPLLLNNYLYIDDTWRTLKASTGWQAEGRMVANLIINLLSVTAAEPNLFPLPLLGAALIIALTLARLAFFWFRDPNLIDCLTLLPLWYNPFFLQLLSYQYDCVTATISLSAMIMAITFSRRATWLHFLASGVCVAAALGIYQISLHVFTGLAGAYLLYQLSCQCSPQRLLRLVLFFVGSLLLGGILYFLTFFQMITHDRGGVVLLGLPDLLFRFTYYYSRVAFFITPLNAAIFLPLAVISLVGMVQGGVMAIVASSRGGKLLTTGLLVLALAAVILSLPGIGLIVADYEDNAGARILMGAGPLLVVLLLFFQRALQVVDRRLSLLMVLPLWVVLSFSFSYGNVMHQKQMNETMLLNLLVGDINQHDSLYQAEKIYIDNETNQYSNLFPVNCAVRQLPALGYVFESRYVVLPEQLEMSGIRNTAIGRVPPPQDAGVLLRRKFWTIYTDGKNAWIVFNQIMPADNPCSN